MSDRSGRAGRRCLLFWQGCRGRRSELETVNEGFKSSPPSNPNLKPSPGPHLVVIGVFLVPGPPGSNRGTLGPSA